MERLDSIKQAAKIENPLKRQMTIAAIITAELEQTGTRIVLVGGSALEFYTVAQYLTIDIDFVATKPDDIALVMNKLGFINHGGTWIHAVNEQIIVEFPKGPLAGSFDKIQPVSIGAGIVYVIGLEDIILDRLLAAKFWNDGSELWVEFLFLSRPDEIDWRYLSRRSREENCEDWLLRIRRRARNKINKMNQK